MSHTILGSDAIIITPGIRLKGDNSQDQKRIADPKYAFYKNKWVSAPVALRNKFKSEK